MADTGASGRFSSTIVPDYDLEYVVTYDVATAMLAKANPLELGESRNDDTRSVLVIRYWPPLCEVPQRSS